MPELVELGTEDFEMITAFFKSVFTAPPWNDDWSDENQLREYINDLAGKSNSLSFGLFENGKMLGLSLGSVKHWYRGTEYCIDEFCISTEIQGRGLGTLFMKAIEERLKRKNIVSIFLQTERNVPAYKFYLKNNFVELKEHISFAKDIEKIY